MVKSAYFGLGFLIIVLVSCSDGQDRIYKSHHEILQENKLLDSFSNKEILFIPESYAEKVTDTTFNNGYSVHVKMFSDMYNFVTVKSGKENINFRDFNLEIKVIKNGEVLLDKTFNKLNQHIIENSTLDLKYCILRDFWIDIKSEYYQYQNVPVIYFEYYSPETKENEVMSIIALKDRYDFYTN